jgi:endonuclease/exonuclease/phosphatase (EEP) superfamily protein YafD
VAFSEYALVPAALVGGAALVLRRWAAAALALLSTVVFAFVVVPRVVAGGAGAGSGPHLRVLTVNMRVGGADPAAVVDLVRRHEVDLLALQEYTPEARDALESAGLGRLLPQAARYPRPGVIGSALYARVPLRDDGLRVHRASNFGQARAVLAAPGAAPVAVESAHPCAPAGRYADACWAADQADQPTAGDGKPRLLLGDFNATLDHAPLRALVATGYRDAADATGEGLTPTWPYDKVFPRITIDHVLCGHGIGVTGYAVYPVPNTDHRAVFADLVLPEA